MRFAMVSLSFAAVLSLIAGAGSAHDSGPGAELRQQLGLGQSARRVTLAERRLMYTPLIKPNQFLEGELGEGDGLLQNGWILDEWSYQGRKNELISFSVKASYDALVVVFIQQGTDRKENRRVQDRQGPGHGGAQAAAGR